MIEKSEHLLGILGEVDEDLIEAATPKKKAKASKPSPLKWISAAACFVLVAGIGVGVWRSGITDPSSAVSKADDIPKVSDNTTELPENTDTSDTPAITDTQHEPNSGEDAIGGGTYGECPLHGLGTYTGIPGELIDYVGMENFRVWIEPYEKSDYNNQRTDGCICKVTLMDFIEYFDIPDEVIIDCYYNKGGYYTEDWDLDIILARDKYSFDEYAQIHQGFDEEMMKRETERRFKRDLLDYIENSSNEEIKAYWSKLSNNGKRYSYGTWSIAEFVNKTGIDIDTLNSILTDIHPTGEEQPMFEYDFSLLYDEESMAYFLENPDGLYPIQIDMLLRK